MAASIADGTQVYDDLLQRFIVTGYVVLPPNPSVPASVHADIASSVLACGFQASGRRTPYGLAMLDGDAAGNNLLHAAPALRGDIGPGLGLEGDGAHMRVGRVQQPCHGLHRVARGLLAEVDAKPRRQNPGRRGIEFRAHAASPCLPARECPEDGSFT